MKKVLQHPTTVLLVLMMFVNFSLTGCEKSVTKYHPDGTPYTVKEYSSGETLGGVLLGLLAISALAACSFVHGSVDNSVVTGVLQGESLIGGSEGFNKKFFIDSLENNDLTKYKPVQLQDMSGKVLTEFVIFGDNPRPNDRILSTISPEILIPYWNLLESHEITNKVKLSLLIKSDFTLSSNNRATIIVKEIEFLEVNPTESYFHSTVTHKGQEIDFFIEAEICRLK